MHRLRCCAPSGVSGVHRGGTVYLNTHALEDGKWASVLFEEATHFTDGTAEAADFKAFLEKEDGLFEDVAEGLLAQDNAYGFTDENVMGEKSETFNREMYAQMASRVLTSQEYVDKLVRADRTLAEKIKNRISDVAETLRSVTSKDIEIRKQLRRATKAQGLFERALESVTSTNDEKMHVSGESEFAFVEPFVDDSGTRFENAVLLDTNFFDNISPRNWGRELKNYVENRSETNPVIMPVLDENGNKQELRFARKQERVSKNGGSEHQVLSELYKTSDNISKLSVLHIDEIVEVSEENNPYHTGENSHGRFDRNG